MDVSAPILVSGFEPFGGETVNASWEAVRLLPDEIDGHPVKKLLLPVEFGRSGDVLEEAICAERPCVAIAVGEAGGHTHLTVERVAVNLMRARIPDNAGFQPDGISIVPGGPDAYLATLPVDACVEAAHKVGVPAQPSETAGLYVCNQALYRMLHAIACNHMHIKAGFIHVPYLPCQVLEKPGKPFCPADISAAGIVAAIRETLCFRVVR